MKRYACVYMYIYIYTHILLFGSCNSFGNALCTSEMRPPSEIADELKVPQSSNSWREPMMRTFSKHCGPTVALENRTMHPGTTPCWGLLPTASCCQEYMKFEALLTLRAVGLNSRFSLGRGAGDRASAATSWLQRAPHRPGRAWWIAQY